LTVSSEPYVNLTGGTPLVTQGWDDPEFTVPIGFNFQFYNETLNTIYQLADISYPILLDGSADFVESLFIPFGADLLDRGISSGQLLSPITYKTEGSTGHRILTVEWKNAGFYGEYFINQETNDYVNVQMKLYEENGNIVFHYGPSFVANPALDYDSTGAFVGLVEDLDLSLKTTNGETLLLSGSPLKPSIVTEYVPTYLNGTIPPNTVYTFSREITATNDITSVSHRNYFNPNPTQGDLYSIRDVEGKITSPVYVYDAIGSLVLVDDTPNMISMNGKQEGIYLLKFEADGVVRTERILVSR
jgi:hypothetical protein